MRYIYTHTHTIRRLTVSHVFQGDFIALDIMKIRISKLNPRCRQQVRTEKLKGKER